MTEEMQVVLLILLCASILTLPLVYALCLKRFDLVLLILASYTFLLGARGLWYWHADLRSFFTNPLGIPLLAGGLLHLIMRRKISAAALCAAILIMPVYGLAVEIPIFIRMALHGKEGYSWSREMPSMSFLIIPLAWSALAGYSISKLEGKWY